MELTMKRCKTCTCEKHLAEFATHPNTREGLRGSCRDCLAAAERFRRETDPRVRERDRARYRNNPERRAQVIGKPITARERLSKIASQRVMRAVRKGILTRPDRCQRCGDEGYVEGAHTDYAAPLDVIWLCRPCHRKWDAAAPKTKAG